MENWDGEQVTNKMKDLEETFNEFANTLKELNDYIETNLNVNADSAAFGKYGTKLLNSWNQNASTFGDFHANFNNWVQTVALISANNAEFIVDANAEYKSHAGSLDEIESARNYIASDDIAYEDLDDVTKKVLENGGIPKKETKETDDESIEDDDGILEVKESENEEELPEKTEESTNEEKIEDEETSVNEEPEKNESEIAEMGKKYINEHDPSNSMVDLENDKDFQNLPPEVKKYVRSFITKRNKEGQILQVQKEETSQSEIAEMGKKYINEHDPSNSMVDLENDKDFQNLPPEVKKYVRSFITKRNKEGQVLQAQKEEESIIDNGGTGGNEKKKGQVMYDEPAGPPAPDTQQRVQENTLKDVNTNNYTKDGLNIEETTYTYENNDYIKYKKGTPTNNTIISPLSCIEDKFDNIYLDNSATLYPEVAVDISSTKYAFNAEQYVDSIKNAQIGDVILIPEIKVGMSSNGNPWAGVTKPGENIAIVKINDNEFANLSKNERWQINDLIS